MLFGSLSHPLLWQDEAETAMFGRRVLEYGYPKVHGPRNVVYQFGFDAAMGVKERCDAYIGTTWGQFYFATIGLALAGEGGDLYGKTLRLRLPFALAGAAGVLVPLLALLPALSGARARLAFASACLSRSAPASPCSSTFARCATTRSQRSSPPPSAAVHVLHFAYRRRLPPLRLRHRAPPAPLLPHLLRRILRLPRSLRRRSAARPARAAAASRDGALLHSAAPSPARRWWLRLLFFETFSTARLRPTPG
jgi:hypothetical protein